MFVGRQQSGENGANPGFPDDFIRSAGQSRQLPFRCQCDRPVLSSNRFTTLFFFCLPGSASGPCCEAAQREESPTFLQSRIRGARCCFLPAPIPFRRNICESATVTQFVCTARDVGSLAARLRARYEARARQFFLLNLIHEDAVPSNRRSPRVQANSRSPKLVGMSTSLHLCEPQPWTSVPLPSPPQS